MPSEIGEEQIHAKWADPRHRETARTSTIPASSAPSSAYDKLADVKICAACQAQGIIKVQYGYRVMDQVCEQCDGEGCIHPKQKKRDEVRKMTTAEKVERVQKLIQDADSLADLDRYEAALRSGMLDEVLLTPA